MIERTVSVELLAQMYAAQLTTKGEKHLLDRDRLYYRLLRQIARQCVNYGQRVQNSVFECLLDAAQCRQLQHKLRAIMNEESDSLRFYYLGNNYHARIEHFGVKAGYDAEGALMI